MNPVPRNRKRSRSRTGHRVFRTAGATVCATTMALACVAPAAAQVNKTNRITLTPPSGGGGTLVNVHVRCTQSSKNSKVFSKAFVASKKLKRAPGGGRHATVEIEFGLKHGKSYRVTAVCTADEIYRTEFTYKSRPHGPAKAGMGGLSNSGTAMALAVGGGLVVTAAGGYVLLLRRRADPSRHTGQARPVR